MDYCTQLCVLKFLKSNVGEKFGIIGAGNMAQAIIFPLFEKGE